MRANPTRPASVLALTLLLVLAPVAFAQDTGPASAFVKEQEALRIKQLNQVHGAYGKAVAPIDGSRNPVPPAIPETAADETPKERPTRWGPWALGGLAVVAAGFGIRAFRSAQ